MADGSIVDLDAHFGPCIQGQRKNSEIDVASIAWHVLDAETAIWLEQIRSISEANMLLQRHLTNVTILWLVAEDGLVRFCIEQSYEDSSPNRRFARPRETDDKSKLLPLGHPMLADNDSARIAGELYLEQEGPKMVWVLSNKSARYGVGRERTHLTNVAVLFESLGVAVDQYFLE